MLGHTSALGHCFERGVAEPINSQLVAQLPDTNEHLIAGEVVEVGKDVSGVEKVLGVGEHFNRCVGESHKVLKSLILALVEELSVKGGLGAQKVLLNAEGGLFRTDEGDDEDGVRLTRGL